jgi:hypothetical protein
MARTGTAPLILMMLIVAAAGASGTAHAEDKDCLGGPNAQSPQGKHWYYRIDRASHRKCWYLGEINKRRAAAQTNKRRRAASRPEELEEDAAPDPGVSSRWPDAPPSAAIVAGPRAEPAPAPARVAATDPGAVPLGARPVPTERVRSEAPPAKPPEAASPPEAANPPEPAKPQAAPAPAARAGSALPAALFGIALLLAVVGTILVRARRRLVKTQRNTAARSLERGRSSGRARRSLSDILARAEAAAENPDGPVHRPHETERNPGLPTDLDTAWAPDIAAATLQPANDPLMPDAIEPAPDVEQSLRELLAEWERRAA